MNDDITTARPFQAEGITAITREEWDDIFPEHKTVIGDQHYVLVDSAKGSVWIPVEIEEEEDSQPRTQPAERFEWHRWYEYDNLSQEPGG